MEPQTPDSNPPARKIGVLVGVFVVLIAAGIVVGGRFSKKAQQDSDAAAPQPHAHASTTNAASHANSEHGSTPPTAASYPEWKSPDGSGLAEGKIALRTGLTVVTALAQPMVGDYESIKRIEGVTEDSVRIAYSADLPSENASSTQPAASTRRKSCMRTVQFDDLRRASEYRENFCGSKEESYPGTTAISASTQTLADLKAKGEAQFKYQQNSTGGPPDETCMLNRVEPFDLAIPVLLNGRRVSVPALHARCRSQEDQEDSEFYFLDDPDNPLALVWQLGVFDKMQVIKISLAEEPEQIEQALSESGRAEVYGIYFDFASATIRPESEVVLKQIAGILKKNPSWRLNVEGHTDNVGGDAYNLQLSNRRAEAVKQALAERYHVDPTRLSTAGFGATRPKESNETMEGRARNRRVELAR